MICFQIQNEPQVQRNTLEVCMAPFASCPWTEEQLGSILQMILKGDWKGGLCRQVTVIPVHHFTSKCKQTDCHVTYAVTCSSTATGYIKLTVCLLQIKISLSQISSDFLHHRKGVQVLLLLLLCQCWSFVMLGQDLLFCCFSLSVFQYHQSLFISS